MNDMNRRDFVRLLAAAPLASRTASSQTGQEIPITLSGNAAPLVKLAALELAKYLHLLWPASPFRVTEKSPPGGACIRLGTIEDSPQLSRYVSKSELPCADSFVVTTADEGQAPAGIIVGADPRGALFGVYALLEQLGCGFYLSYDAQPEVKPGSLNFDGWQLANAPLVGERIVFNWHNFVSGCSGWDLSGLADVDRPGRQDAVYLHHGACLRQ